MIWVLYDTDPQRANQVSAFLMSRYGIKALPYQEASHLLASRNVPATFLIHCDALKNDFNRLAAIRLSGEHSLRFYCTDQKDRTQQVPYFPEEAGKMVS